MSTGPEANTVSMCVKKTASACDLTWAAGTNPDRSKKVVFMETAYSSDPLRTPSAAYYAVGESHGNLVYKVLTVPWTELHWWNAQLHHSWVQALRPNA